MVNATTGFACSSDIGPLKMVCLRFFSSGSDACELSHSPSRSATDDAGANYRETVAILQRRGVVTYASSASPSLESSFSLFSSDDLFCSSSSSFEDDESELSNEMLGKTGGAGI